jgi:tyrosyl-tRNA synthetase
MDVEERYALIARNTEEIITPEDLREVLRNKTSPTGYIGFEPSGQVHVGWMVTTQKVRDFVDAGFQFTILPTGMPISTTRWEGASRTSGPARSI